MFRYKLDVAPFSVGYGKRSAVGGYHVKGMFAEYGSDALWDYFEHPAVFKDRARAEAFLARILAGIEDGKMNLNNWRLPTNVTAAANRPEAENPAYYGVV